MKLVNVQSPRLVKDKTDNPIVEFDNAKHDDTYIVDFRIMNKSNTLKVSDIRILAKNFPRVPKNTGICITGTDSPELTASLVYRYSKLNDPKFISVFDPKVFGKNRDMGRCFIIGSNNKKYKIGDAVDIPLPETIIKMRTKDTGKVIGFFGDPNSGKSVLVDLVSAEFRRQGYSVHRHECDLAAPTSKGFLEADNRPLATATRKRLKKPFTTEMTTSICENIDPLRAKYDYIVVDVGGGTPSKGIRLTPQLAPIASKVDLGVLLCPEGKEECFKGWRTDLSGIGKEKNIVRECNSDLHAKSGVSSNHELGTCTFGSLYRKTAKEGLPDHLQKAVTEIVHDFVYKGSS